MNDLNGAQCAYLLGKDVEIAFEIVFIWTSVNSVQPCE